MSGISRRKWLRNSLFASSSLLVGARPGFIALEGSPSSEFQLSEEILKLNWNENPYGPSKSAYHAAKEALERSNYYPDEPIMNLKNALARFLNVETDQLMITCGSTEVLSLVGQHAGLLDGEVVTPWPSFPTLMYFAEVAGASIKKVSLDAENRIDLDATANAISDKTKVVFICNPNNPTSTEQDPAAIRSFCRSVPEDVMICVDEAYIEYSSYGPDGSMVPLVAELPNLIVARTFSKAYGLAGLRVGYAVSQVQNIEELEKRHNGFGMSLTMPSVLGAHAAISDQEFITNGVEKNMQSRQIVYNAFDKWGVKYNMSSTNFIYARSEHFDPKVVTKLAEENVLITKWPTMADHIRISMGKPKEMERFVEVIGNYLA